MAITGRPKAPLVVLAAERAELVRLSNRARVNRALAFRAKLVLACASGEASSAVALAFRTTDQTVGKWRRRFVEHRLDGMYDEPRVGAPRKYSDEEVERVLVVGSCRRITQRADGAAGARRGWWNASRPFSLPSAR